MGRLFRLLFRLALALAILAVVAAVAIILLLDTIAREILAGRLRSRTGMEAKISAVHVGLLSPTVTIEGFKLYNTADFGGSVCVDIPELHIEYVPSALRARQLHLTLLRLDLAELSVILDKRGRNNFDTLKEMGRKKGGGGNPAGRLEFTGIDTLNVSLGKFHFSNLASGRGEEIDFGIKDQILRNVKTQSDLVPLGLMALSHGQALSSGDVSADLGKLLGGLFKAP
jgi:uncharacterized protein involved in outer membrane biogenesis